jgi:1-deoxy-D-xylulose-5-phosphate synthase
MKDIRGPKLLHIKTVKGRGWKMSESNPISYHGVSGKPKLAPPDHEKKMPSYNDVMTDTLINLSQSDPRIVAITAAMAEGTGLVRYQKELPERFFDVGIAEGHAVTFAAGLAAAGMKPVVCIYSTFLQRAFDQIQHDVNLQKLPVIFALDRAGLVGQDGATHQGAFDLAYLSSLPGMTVTAPRDGNELRNLLFTALNEDIDGSFAIRYPKDSVIRLDKEISYQPIPIGSWELLLQGEDVALLAVGPLVEESLRAAALLADQGINPTVVNCRFIKPLDRELLSKLVNYKLVVTLEEGNILNGFGAMAANVLYSELGFRGNLQKIGFDDVNIEHATRSEQVNATGLDAAGIAGTVKELLV